MDNATRSDRTLRRLLACGGTFQSGSKLDRAEVFEWTLERDLSNGELAGVVEYIKKLVADESAKALLKLTFAHVVKTVAKFYL